MNEVIHQLQEAFGKSGQATKGMREALNSRIHEVAGQCFFGFDINPDLVKATKMNMVMNNDGAGNIFRQDSLLHPHQWDQDFKNRLAASLGIDPLSLRGPDDLGYFDAIATNPPFGAKLPIKDRETLSQYELGRIWRKREDGTMEVTDNLQTSQPPEILFIERCWQLLKPGGRMAIVLPDAILGAPGLLYVRQWMLNRCRIVATVDLHPDTFQPRNGTQTSVLILQKKTHEEMTRDALIGMRDYAIFAAQVNAIGHDKRGNKTFRRKEDSEEILVDPGNGKATVMEKTAAGDASVRPMPKRKVPDDDTPQVADEFLAWKREVVLGW